jgi:hypothetical protein
MSFTFPHEFVLPTNRLGVRNIQAYKTAQNTWNHAFVAVIDEIAGSNNRYSRPPFIYLPAGPNRTPIVYEISYTIYGRLTNRSWSDGWRSGVIIVGEDPSLVTLKLTDNNPLFQDPTAPRAMLFFGSENDGNPTLKNNAGTGNQGFKNSVINLTIDTGIGNPGAIGVDYLASNRGTISNCKFKGSGLTAIAMNRAGQGPQLIKNVEVDGYAVAFDARAADYQITFDNIVCRNQRTAVFYHGLNTFAIQRLTSINTVPVMRNASNRGLVSFLNCEFRLPDGVSTRSPLGIDSQSRFYIENLKSSAYDTILNQTGSNGALSVRHSSYTADGNGAVTVPLFTSYRQASLFPVRTVPTLPAWEAFPDLTSLNPADYEIVTTNTGAALQAAIDTGKSIVLLPNASYPLTAPLNIPATLRKVIGCQSSISVASGSTLSHMIVVEGSTSNSVEFEHLTLSDPGIRVNSARPVVLRHMDAKHYSTGPNAIGGKLFVEDVIFKSFTATGQKIWIQQGNCEEAGPQFNLIDCDTWVNGMKTERPQTAVFAQGGRLKVLGLALHPLFGTTGSPPAINLVNCKALLCFKNGSSYDYPRVIQETIGSETRIRRKEGMFSFRVGTGNGDTYYVSVGEPVATNSLASDPLIAASETPLQTQGWTKHSLSTIDVQATPVGAQIVTSSAPAAGDTFYNRGENPSKNYTIEATYRIRAAGINDFGIFIHIDKTQKTGYYFRYVDLAGTGRIEIVKVANGVGTLLTGRGLTFSLNVDIPIRVDVVNNIAYYSVEATRFLSAAITEPLAETEAVSFGANNADLTVKVSGLAGTVTLTQPNALVASEAAVFSLRRLGDTLSLFKGKTKVLEQSAPGLSSIPLFGTTITGRSLAGTNKALMGTIAQLFFKRALSDTEISGLIDDPLTLTTGVVPVDTSIPTLQADPIETSVTTAEDNFNAPSPTALGNRVALTGGQWTLHPATTSGTQMFIDTSPAPKRIRGSSAGGSAHFTLYTLPTSTPQKPIAIEATLLVRSYSAQNIFLLGRYNDTANTGYRVTYNNVSGTVTLARFKDGIETPLDSGVRLLAVGEAQPLRLELRQGSQRVFFAGSLIASAADGDVDLLPSNTANQRIGIGVRISPGSTIDTNNGVHLYGFKTETLTIAPPSGSSSVMPVLTSATGDS